MVLDDESAPEAHVGEEHVQVVLDQGPLVQGRDDEDGAVLGQVAQGNVQVVLDGVGQDRLDVDQGRGLGASYNKNKII